MKQIRILACALALSCGLTARALAATDTPISLRLNNADVGSVLRTLAIMADAGMVVDDSVTGKISMILDSVPFEQALDVVVKSRNLAVRKIGDTLVITSPDKGNKGFNAMRVIRLQYAKAKDLLKPLEEIAPKDQMKVHADETSNCILLSGTQEAIGEMERAVAELDKALAQVVIEAEVVEINKTAMKKIGVAYDFKTVPYLDPDYEVKDNKDGKVYDDKTHQRLKLFTVNGESINMGVRATINAQVSKGNGKVLAKPRIMALNNKDARIHLGNKIPIVEYDNEGNKTIEYIDVGIKLDITPQISDDNTIVSKVKTEVSSAAYNSAVTAYEISTRESETTVRLQDGETLIIGGLYNSTDIQSTAKVPLLGDLPLIGQFFKSKSSEKRDTEIIVILRPTIVKNQ